MSFPKPDNERIKRLVTLVNQGQEPALNELVGLIEAHLFRFCVFLTGDRVFAQDLCQDTLIRAIEAMGQLKEPDKFMGWLFSICRRLFIDHCRASQAEAQSQSKDADTDFMNLIAAPGPNPDEILQIRQALLALEPEDRTLILLVDVEEYSYKEASEIIGVSENAVRSRVHRIRKRFLEKFESA
jgi:RNA polymerase sigma-70 factor (ECF subfamily)